MGPSTSVDGEATHRVALRARDLLASMGPSTSVDGEVASAAVVADPTVASMGPSTSVDGETTWSAVIWLRISVLQWGRRQASTERAMA